MIEVFKTEVNEAYHAELLLNQIHQTFIDYKANFDLDDCDKILRVKSTTGQILVGGLINLLNDFGFCAEVLPDDCPSKSHLNHRIHSDAKPV